MKLWITIIFFFFIDLGVFAYNIRGEIKVLDESTTWEVGDVKSVVMIILPLEEVDIEDVKKSLIGKEFLDNFFISKVESINFSPNNPLVLEVHCNMTLKNNFNANRPLIWSYRALNIPFIFKNIEFIKSKGQISDYVIFDSVIGNQNNKKLRSLVLYFLGSFILIITVILILKFRKNKRIKLAEAEMYRKCHERLINAKDRKDFEELYVNRDHWVKILGGINPSFSNLLNTIEKHQYKKDWNEEILSEIYFIHDDIKDSLENV